ncbi:transposase [Vagococcus sp. DIV0080]|uniref:Transposase n=1 Tax=Candidatus Vagococcus giribetii TaxID=2230876 RepID=A0ABS3HUJ1_9ENTE|nr:transposase [Vagococcus sp. DIV0080]MBO0477414.1 transposase [Vagococcus sp. DIV0080]
MLNFQDELDLSPYSGLYDALVKEDHLLRKLNNLADFIFIVDEVKEHYYLKDGCYVDGNQTKTYSISIKSDLHQEQIEFEQTNEFKELANSRYKIEAKNSELKNRHGFGINKSDGLFGMNLQEATTLFVVNLKRILTLIG